MKTFKQLFEAKDAGGHGSEKHHVTAFTRMNPPTTGHMQVISKLHAVAKEHDAGHSLVVSHSNDAKKNPLTPEQKIKHLKRYSPETNVSASSKESPTILHHAAELHKKGVQHLHVVAGSDRHEQMQKLLHQYNNKEAGHGHYNFKSITMHSSGDRDPDSEGTEGMSGTKMRQHAHENNFKEFRKGVPSHVSDKHAHELMSDVRKGSGIKEETISYKTFMEARMTASMKLQKAFQREQEKTASERKAGEELLKKPAPQKTNEHIEKVAGGYEVESEHGNKNLGKSKTLAGAKKRLAQVEYFKHMKEEMQFEDFDDKNIAKQELSHKKNKGGFRGHVIAALKRKAGMVESVHDNRTGFAKKKREDDEGGELYRHTYKYNVSKPGVNDGKKHERHVTTPLTPRPKKDLEHLARAHLTKQGYQIHEEEKRGAYKQKSPVVIAPKDPKAKTYGKIVSKIRTMGEEVELDESMTDSWKSVQSMDKGSVTGGKEQVKKRLAYLNAVHAHHKKFGNDTHKVKKEIEGINRSRIAEEAEEIEEGYFVHREKDTKLHFNTVAQLRQSKTPSHLKVTDHKHKHLGTVADVLRNQTLYKTEETQENQMGLKSFITLVKEGTLQSSGDDSIPTLTGAPAKKQAEGSYSSKRFETDSQRIARMAKEKKIKEEVESIEEALDPSEIASNPRMYSADSAKKAYYHKKASASDKESLARHLDRHHGNKEWRKPVKEETESIEESYAKVETKKYSWGTMKTAHHGASFSVPMHPEHHQAIHALKDQQEHKFKDETGRHWTAKRHGDDVHLHSANDGPKTKIKHSDLKEEVEHIEERNKENATKRKMMDASRGARFKLNNPVPDASPEHKTGQAHNKAIGRALRKEDADLEEAKINAMTPDQKDKPVAPKNKKPAVESDLVNAAGDKPHEEKFETVKKEGFSVSELLQALKEGMWPGTPEYKAKYDGAKQGGGAGIKKGSHYGGSLQKDEPETDNDDAPKAGRKVGSKSGARKNLGNSKLHK